VKTSRPSILLLTTRTGGGHVNLAQSLEETLRTHYDVEIADPYPDTLRDYYTMLSRHLLWAWDLQYRFTNNPAGSLLLHRVLTFSIKKRIAELIERVQPQVIVSTHALLSYEVRSACDALHLNIPLVFQLTDLEEVHIAWFTERHASAYLAPSREIRQQAVQHGIASDRLYTTGRPVRQQFLEVMPSMRDETLKTLGLDPALFTIFLQGGARGSAGIDQTVRSILAAEIPMQIIMAVGNNTALAKHFAGIARLSVLPFTPLIAPYMASSDLIAGKAGASFISEAFTLEKPFLVTNFIPGQEMPTLHFLKRHDLGWVSLDANDQKQLLTTLASTPALMKEKIAHVRAYREWNQQANQAILPLMKKLLVL
jgi:UDP-N-acetylglucosamine:LPS N-acetylglucosamine transferase